MASNNYWQISLQESALFLLLNLIVLLFGIIMWYFIWIKRFGGEIPNAQLSSEKTISYFSSKNFTIVLRELFSHINSINKQYLIHTVGYEGYIYLLFQRTMISLLITVVLFSFIFSALNLLVKEREGQSDFFTFVQNFLLNNKYLNDYTTIVHVIAIALYTFLHFRFFSQIRREASYVYFDRFDKMSKHKNADWLCCRTLHISGLGPKDRSTESLIKKLNVFLEQNEGGRVIDINIIPDQKEILKLEKRKTQISNVRHLIDRSKLNCYERCFFPKIYHSDEITQKEIDSLSDNIKQMQEQPVFSSGHAFVCLDSLISCYQIINSFKESTWKKVKIKFTAVIDSIRHGRSIREGVIMNQQVSAKFEQFQDEEYDNNNEIDNSNSKVNIIVDPLVEPFDIIWLNVGGDRGVNICRQIICNILIVFILLFLTTSTSYISSQKMLQYFEEKKWKWIIFSIPYGHLLITYIPPLALLGLSIGINVLIGIMCRFEMHYTHSNYQYAIFAKCFTYMLFNLFLIPGFALSFDSLYALITSKVGVQEIISKVYIKNTGYFFITLLIQNGTISSVYYLLRLDELIFNSFSPILTFYYRHFINTGNQRHRNEGSCFFYGFFYAQMMVFYTICLVFSSTVPLIPLAGIYLFIIKHITDFISLLMVHGCEMDSNGKLINCILNYSSISIFIFHGCMISLFLVKEKYTACVTVVVICLMSGFYAWKTTSDYIFDFYALHERLNKYDELSGEVSKNEINVWRNMFRHPLAVPLYVEPHKERKNKSNSSMDISNNNGRLNSSDGLINQ